jgi:hypothetical protein
MGEARNGIDAEEIAVGKRIEFGVWGIRTARVCRSPTCCDGNDRNEAVPVVSPTL